MTVREFRESENFGIVQCKNCVYGDARNGTNRFCTEWSRLGKDYIVGEDFFCAKGKRKEKAR